ncbi:MFS family permease [Paenibacillus sp. PvP094]|uniref:MFS transporter n=1 Tax=Paenibacillus sp. PvP094 TaxID=3156394 RepID=UPI0033992839
MKNPYIKTSLGMYLNYFMLGMINIIIASNMSALSENYNRPVEKISLLVSAIGIGKLIALFFAGRLSDKIGRKPIIITGSFLYLLFLVGIPLMSSYPVAFVLAITAGIANSLLDSGTYPALIESFPKKSSSATVLVKAIMSIGATLLPFILAILVANDISWGWSFYALGALFLISGIYLIFMPFPAFKTNAKDEVESEGGKSRFKEEPKFWGEGLAIILIGFTSTSLFVVWQTWLPELGSKFIGLSENVSVQLLSYFSIGALVSVLLLAAVLDKLVKPITVMILYPLIAFLSMLSLFFVQSYPIVIIMTFILGLSTSGTFQLAITVMTQFFVKNKGTTTSYVNIAGSLAFILIPFISSFLVGQVGISMTLVLDMIIALLSALLAAFVLVRGKKVFR